MDRAQGCRVLHVDMDAFFASVEVRRDPSLAGLPVIVGGSGGRGVVTSATYEARARGVHSAMPTARALRLCPDAVVVPGDLALYSEVSRGVMAVFRTITPLVEPLSLDEAFLDVSGAGRRLGDPLAIAELVRARIHDEQGITCSVGVAPTKFVAKVASTRSKPDGLLVVRPHEVVDFLHPLPVSALWGVGPKTAEALLRLGLRTVGDLAHAPAGTVEHALGRGAGGHLHELSWGRDPRRVVPDEPERSTGAEETFGADVDDPVVIHRELLHLAERVAGRLRSAGFLARTVTLKVRFADFTTITRSRTLAVPSDVGQQLYGTARDLFDALGLDRVRVRLVGVRAERLARTGSTPTQLELGAPEHGRRDAELAADRAARRFGAGAVRPATLLGRAGAGRAHAARPTDRPGHRRAAPDV
ncbi:DNA polymerase-4 [Klenkia soli]|uniref:DNA polymerase IV n=1 Tax=Klenkia soli TaxID=1052260 RepID=A0A1H0M954_9ACTN|nr:DNA polymerase IV [Klenkia soli]SDO76999.1 DNA polymerase-4 [Klenkia soli]